MFGLSSPVYYFGPSRQTHFLAIARIEGSGIKEIGFNSDEGIVGPVQVMNPPALYKFVYPLLLRNSAALVARAPLLQ
jgi:hypothetical protein